MFHEKMRWKNKMKCRRIKRKKKKKEIRRARGKKMKKGGIRNFLKTSSECPLLLISNCI